MATFDRRAATLGSHQLTIEPHGEDVLTGPLVIRRLRIRVDKVRAVTPRPRHLVVAPWLRLRGHAKRFVALHRMPASPAAGFGGDLNCADAARVVRADGHAHCYSV